MRLTRKNDIVMGLVSRENNILVMQVRHVLEIFRFSKIDIASVLIDP